MSFYVSKDTRPRLCRKYRIYPNTEQERIISHTIGCSKKWYNECLANNVQTYNAAKEAGIPFKKYLKDRPLYVHKQARQLFPYMAEADSVGLVGARNNLDDVLKAFFSSLKGKRKGPKMGFPNSKCGKLSRSGAYRTRVNKIDYDERKIKLPKVRWVPYRDRDSNPIHLDGEMKNYVTVSKAPSGKFYVSIQYAMNNTETVNPTIYEEIEKYHVVGIDMSFTYGYIDSDGRQGDLTKLVEITDYIAALQKKRARSRLVPIRLSL